MANNPVNWFEIYVQDTARAKAFYQTVLGINLDRLDAPGPGVSEMWMFPSEEKGMGATGALVKMDGGPSNGNSIIVYFSCDDCGVEAKRVPAAGGKIMRLKWQPATHHADRRVVAVDDFLFAEENVRTGGLLEDAAKSLLGRTKRGDVTRNHEDAFRCSFRIEDRRHMML